MDKMTHHKKIRASGKPAVFLMRCKSRWVEGEPVPMNVLRVMVANPVEPWVIRDRMLDEMGWWPKGRPWAEWKAKELNRLFQEQGVTGEPGQITAATVRQGEQSDWVESPANPVKKSNNKSGAPARIANRNKRNS
jgi:hypothetical protein